MGVQVHTVGFQIQATAARLLEFGNLTYDLRIPKPATPKRRCWFRNSTVQSGGRESYSLSALGRWGLGGLELVVLGDDIPALSC